MKVASDTYYFKEEINMIDISAYPPGFSVLVDQTKSRVSRQKLEKHIKDHNSGEGHRSREMYSETKRNSLENSEMLSRSNAETANMYASYSTLFSTYEKKARMNAHLNHAIKHTLQLKL
jgi:hypothetical protein